MQGSLLSPEFLAIAGAAIVLLQVLAGAARQLAFLTLNVVFLVTVVLAPEAAAGILVFVLVGYGLTRLSLRTGGAGFAWGLVLYVALFAYLRRYEFLTWLLPDSLLGGALGAVGLSFVFFKIVHVAIDAHSGTLGPLDLPTYLNYCLNFTTFTMGPIQRYQDYREQWDGSRPAIPLDFEAHFDAVLRVLAGFVKAYVAAPWFQDRALQPDTDLLTLTPAGLIVHTYAFWMYLYLNFSGYCDTVIGIGSLMGVRPPENFDKPFLARNISDFWLRQHRSLTLWLTDYVFNPVYKQLLSHPWTARHRLLAANLSLFTTMVVSGLWHGTTFGFLLFGVVHGLWFVVYRTWDELLIKRFGREAVRRFRGNPIVHAGGVVLTFNATAFTFILFQVRSEQIARALMSLVSR